MPLLIVAVVEVVVIAVVAVVLVVVIVAHGVFVVASTVNSLGKLHRPVSQSWLQKYFLVGL